MWYPASVVEPPESTAPLTLDQAKRQCGIALENDDLDDELERLMMAARDHVERYCAIYVPTQTVSVKCDSFCDFARVPVAPVQSITSIAYVDTHGEARTLAPSSWDLRNDDLTVSIAPAHGARWPTILPDSRITVVAVAGFAVVPPAITSAMLLVVRAQRSLTGSDVNLKKKVVEGVGSREWDMTGAIDGITRQAIASFLEPFRCWPLS